MTEQLDNALLSVVERLGMDDDVLEKFSFPPVAGLATRLLILGSLPGEESLRRGQYYANPRNQFWRLIGAVIETKMLDAYEARLVALQTAGVGLWDVVKSARRRGSLDAAITGHTPNALLELAQSLPDLRAIAFNGGKASKIGRAALGDGPTSIALIDLPSSSPAHTLAFDQKLETRRGLRSFL